MRTILIAGMLAGALAGCMAGDAGPDIGEDRGSLSPTITPVIGELALPGMETFLIESSRPLIYDSGHLDRQQWHEVQAPVGDDPCACLDASCLDTWVDKNLGCDICVVLYCDGQPGPHLCNQCEPTTMDGPSVPQ